MIAAVWLVGTGSEDYEGPENSLRYGAGRRMDGVPVADAALLLDTDGNDEGGQREVGGELQGLPAPDHEEQVNAEPSNRDISLPGPDTEGGEAEPEGVGGIAGDEAFIAGYRAAGGREEWERLICSYPWPCGEAIAVALCESSLNPGADSGDSVGLFQIHFESHARRVDGDRDRLFDAETNVAVAYAIYLDNAGWGPWSCKP